MLVLQLVAHGELPTAGCARIGSIGGHRNVVVNAGHDGGVRTANRRRVVVSNSRSSTEALRLPAGIQNVLGVHRTGVESGSFVRRQRATETVISTRDLHRLILDIVVRLADTLLVLQVLVGHTTCAALVIVASLVALEIFESIASLWTDRTAVLLVALRGRVDHEVILVLLVHRGLALVGH